MSISTFDILKHMKFLIENNQMESFVGSIKESAQINAV